MVDRKLVERALLYLDHNIPTIYQNDNFYVKINTKDYYQGLMLLQQALGTPESTAAILIRQKIVQDFEKIKNRIEAEQLKIEAEQLKYED